MEFDDITYSLFFVGGSQKVNVISPPFQEEEKLHGAVRGHWLYVEDILKGLLWIQMQLKLKQHNLKMVGDQKR